MVLNICHHVQPYHLTDPHINKISMMLTSSKSMMMIIMLMMMMMMMMMITSSKGIAKAVNPSFAISALTRATCVINIIITVITTDIVMGSMSTN